MPRFMNVAGVALLTALPIARPSGAQVTTTCGASQVVSGVWSENPGKRVYLEDYVHIGVCALDSLLHAARESNRTVALYVNGIDAQLEPVKVDLDSGIVTFELDRTEKNRQMWKPFLYDALASRYETLRFSVGVAGGQPLRRAAGVDGILELDKIWVDSSTWLWAVFVLVVIGVAFLLGVRTDILREGPAENGKLQAYSLARVQMAWWFVITVTAFIFIWLITGDRDTVPASVLALMGISAATALAAQQVAPSAAARAAARRARAIAESEALGASLALIEQQISALAPSATDDASETDARKKLEEKKAQLVAAQRKTMLDAATVALSTPSRGFFRDLVTNDAGVVALDRLQIAVWTAVLGGVFLHSVRIYLAIPEFSSTLLTLQGISSGTYIGFKLPAARGDAS